MGHAPNIEAEENWEVAEAVRQADKKFSTDLSLLMRETTNDETLVKTLVCLERQQYDQIPAELRIYKKKLSTRYGLLFYEDRIVIPNNLKNQIIAMLHKGHPSIVKMTDNADIFWWPKMSEDIQKKCNNCIPCRMTGKNIKPLIPFTEKNKLPKLDKPNEEIQLDFIGPISVKQRNIYILLSVDRYSKWPAACLTKSPNGTTVVKFLEQYVRLNGVPKVIRTDQGTAFTGRTFRDYCKTKFIKLIYGTPYLHTATGLVERGVRTLKDYMMANLNDGHTFNESLDKALETMRMTCHSTLKKSAFEMHFGRKPRSEINNYLGVEPKVTGNQCVLAKPDTVAIYSFGDTDQLIMKTPRKSRKPVSKNLPFYFLEKKPIKNKFEGSYQNQPKKAITETEHTVTTEDGRVIHKKLISKPLQMFQEKVTLRGTNPRDQGGRWTRREHTPEGQDVEDNSESANTTPSQTEEAKRSETVTSPIQTGYARAGIGRGIKKRLIRDRSERWWLQRATLRQNRKRQQNGG